MNHRVLSATLIVLLSATLTAPAIDRGARMIDTIGLEGTTSDSRDTLAVSLWGETRTSAETEKWAILFGGSLGKVWPEADFGSAKSWELGVGLKYYLIPSTSLALTGTYGERDWEGRPDTRAADLLLKHRLLPAVDDVSPYLLVGLGQRNVEVIVPPEFDTDFREWVWTFGVGCDFMMGRNYAFVFEGSWNVTDGVSDDPDSDDWVMGLIGMRYYWDLTSAEAFMP